MSMKRMKAIDHWLGLPLCAALGAAVKLAARIAPRRRDIPARPRRILVMKFFGLGSLVLAGPMLRAIRRRYPDSKLIFLTFDATAAIVRRMGVCDEVRQIRTNGLLPFATDVLRHLARFAQERVDLCVDLEFFSKFSTLMSVFSAAPVRVAFYLNTFWRSSLVTHPVYYNYYRHISEAYNDAARALDAPVTDPQPLRLEIDASLTDRCREKLRAAGWNGADRLVAVNVNAGELSFERRWPLERFAALVSALCARPGVQPVLTGAPHEAPYVAQLVDRLPPDARARVLNLAGKLGFDEFIASMDLYDFLITGDSGPLHLAYAQGLDTISLWGVTRPSFYGPIVGNHSTFYDQLPCSPCLNMFTSEVGQWCDHRADCMRRIETASVLETVDAYLATARGQRAAVTVRQGW